MPTALAVRRSFTVLAVSAIVSAGVVGVAEATPPGIPSTATAKTQLAGLTVKADGSSSGYSRDKFPHWADQGNSCNTREVVLKRDGTNVQQDSSCAAVSGKWFSPYDDATWTAASDLDIDHVVPLAAAWRTGASSWTTAQRQAFANDLSAPQLIAVTDNVNQEKGDKSPDAWKPPSTGYWCTYAKMWTTVKYKYKLTIKSAEKTALTDMLNRC
ncbi:HNH endonuclease family protein [Amycolatopsis azurea]|uniref:HNH endonuclease n=1 Tax=Amycolatopsis azurea DSM 43854 TaxID=1238180 RepID=M2QQ33_9PSEU|nr:HNH endonuclease family protein [Amycolatopsis azurea]EMD28786.1 putative secreted protein [Amycolatopsis azurea DSM 43854]OOC04063.1 HNH endonuclease [Amycolatopsis azurea DSM 43854]